MTIENVFRSIPGFEHLTMDKILFEGQYPVLFTYIDNEKVYLFICYYRSNREMSWIGTATEYDNLIQMLQNKVTIREAFMAVTEDKMMITYDGYQTTFSFVKRDRIPEDILPTDGEFMDADVDEFSEEIDEFRFRKHHSVFFQNTLIRKPRKIVTF